MEAVRAQCETQINAFSDLLEDLPDTDEPVWLLGEQYCVKAEKSELLSDIRSRLWFTYRKKFCPIGGTGPCSDTGWGCMLRCGQMILAQALVYRHLGREWRWEKENCQPEEYHRILHCFLDRKDCCYSIHQMEWRWEKENCQPEEYHRILHCFLDRKDCCYSIHQMAQMGVGEGKSVGEWYGPNTVAQVLKKLALFDEWNSLAVYVSMDNTVVIEDIKTLCKLQPMKGQLKPSSSGQVEPQAMGSMLGQLSPQAQGTPGWKPLLLIIPLRMGINHINPVYIEALKECFKMPQSLGVLGGKPNLAYYFIGFIGDELIYLDPHTTQAAVDPDFDGTVDDQSYHCQRRPRRMKILNLDPSVAVYLNPWFLRELCLVIFYRKLALFDEWNSLAVYVSMDNTVVIEDIKTLCKLQPMKGQLKPSSSGQVEPQAMGSMLGQLSPQAQGTPGWKPLLLIIPLRMGINHINPVYIEALKECFKMPQSLGVLGGKPNLAYYFIGFIGDELIYLDPHTTQAAVDPDFDGTVDDQSYHCQRRPQRMKILNLDPSVAVEILKKRCFQMFELVEKHPPHWPPFIPPTKPEVQTTGAELIESMDKLFESEEEFEILNV
ncbi:UNVERIFIED_CONTAM: hypothetical protein FKN15_035348 [Acipenser sinensis]